MKIAIGSEICPGRVSLIHRAIDQIHFNDKRLSTYDPAEEARIETLASVAEYLEAESLKTLQNTTCG
jgi:hypothetical protein